MRETRLISVNNLEILFDNKIDAPFRETYICWRLFDALNKTLDNRIVYFAYNSLVNSAN